MTTSNTNVTESAMAASCTAAATCGSVRVQLPAQSGAQGAQTPDGASHMRPDAQSAPF